MKLTLAFSILFLFGTTICTLSQEQSPSIPAKQETVPNGRKYVPKQEIPFNQAIMVLGFEKILSSKKESLLIQNRTQETVTRINCASCIKHLKTKCSTTGKFSSMKKFYPV